MKTPLKGLKILDLSTLLPGPYASMLLADLGADVLRVESASRHDLVRGMKPQIDGQSAAFSYLNRGKQSLALNLKHPDAVGVISQRLAQSMNIQDNPPLEERQFKTLLQQKISHQDLDSWCEQLADLDICVEPVLTVTEASEHPQFRARNMIVTRESGERQIDSALGFEKQPIRPAPLCGEQAEQTMAKLGYGPSEIEALRNTGLFD